MYICVSVRVHLLEYVHVCTHIRTQHMHMYVLHTNTYITNANSGGTT